MVLRRDLCIALAALLLLVSATESLAQTASDAQSGDESPAVVPDARLEEIVVRGERRERNLDETAAAISSFSASDLDARGLTNFNTLQYNVPSLFSGGGLTRVTVRGVGSEIVGPGVDPGFSVHVNGVYSARETTGLLDYFDVESVDVLRGPQGMLWGRNSTGGAVNIVTARPRPDLGGSFDLEYSRPDDVLVRGMVNLPLVEDVLLSRFAVLGHWSTGYTQVDAPGNHERLNDDETGSLRASLRWLPADGVTIDLIGSYYRQTNDGPNAKYAGAYTTRDPVLQGDGFGRGLDYTGALPNPSDPYRVRLDENQFLRTTVWTGTLIAALELGDLLLTSTTGYQDTDFHIHRDQDGSSLPLQVLDLWDRSRQLSQEFLLQSDGEGRLDWTLGGTYQWDQTPLTRVRIPNAQSTNASPNYSLAPILLGETLIDGYVPGCTPGSSPTCPPTKFLGTSQSSLIDIQATVDNHVAGVFGHASYDLREDLRASAGVRYSYTHRRWRDDSLTESYLALLPGSTPPNFLPWPIGLLIRQVGINANRDWQAVTWKVGLEYDLFEDHLLWATVGTGERAGGFNLSQESPFDAEKILAVEAGARAKLWNERVRLALTGFWYDWEDPQITERVNSVNTVLNAPSATSYGIELELDALLTDALLVNAALGWLEAYYDQKFLSADSTVVTNWLAAPVAEKVVDLDGKRISRSPRFSVALGAQYDFDLGHYGKVTPRVDFYYRDAIGFRQFGNPKDTQGSFTRTDVRLTWRSPDERMWAELFVRNLEDEAVKTNQEILNGVDRMHYYDPPINGGFRVGFSY